jgi:parvulin-like peptidyl-prolyl isomerase
MKTLAVILLTGSLLTLPACIYAAEASNDNAVLAKRGKGVVTQSAFAARADKIPQNIRRSTLRDGDRVRDLINALLIRSQLAEDAREAGFDQEKIVIDRMQLAAEAELADAWLQHYIDTQPAADYAMLAREYYQLHQHEIVTSSEINVSHILISTKERSEEAAKVIAGSVRQQLQENPKAFDELVMKYSEDPSAISNNGHFKNVKKGDMVKAFEKVAFALEPGEISQPVYTEYGYHIIRLDAHIAPEEMSFDDVEAQLMDKEREKHENRIRQEYLGSITALDVEMTEDGLREMVKRIFGENYAVPRTESGVSE